MVQKFFSFLVITSLMAMGKITSLSASEQVNNDLLEYGEYLAGECRSCHKDNTKTQGIPPNEGIPSIVGIETNTFISILTAYKNEKLKNETMISVAKSLDEEQIKALALYFYSIKQTKKTSQK